MSVTINTRTNKNRYLDLFLHDLDSIASFSKWLKQHLVTYSTMDVPNGHILIYLDYIDDLLDASDLFDRLEWRKSIIKLKKVLGENSEL